MVTSYGAMHFANAPMLSLLGITGGDGRSESDAHAARVLAVLRRPRPDTAPRLAPGPDRTGRRGAAGPAVPCGR